MVKELQGLNLISFGVSTILIILVSITVSDPLFAQPGPNATQSQNVSNAIANVLNITNQTNPTGAVVQQMIQATSAANSTNVTS